MEERERFSPATNKFYAFGATSREAYAEGILKICDLYWQSPLRCVSGVSGQPRKRELSEIMTNRKQARLSAAQKMLLAAGGGWPLHCPLRLE